MSKREKIDPRKDLDVHALRKAAFSNPKKFTPVYVKHSRIVGVFAAGAALGAAAFFFFANQSIPGSGDFFRNIKTS